MLHVDYKFKRTVHCCVNNGRTGCNKENIFQDVPLFEGIYSDLFPGVKLPAFERAELIECLIAEIKRRNLQPTPWFVEKCMQVYEMILVRHGLMIVGRPMGGKTCAYQVSRMRFPVWSDKILRFTYEDVF